MTYLIRTRPTLTTGLTLTPLPGILPPSCRKALVNPLQMAVLASVRPAPLPLFIMAVSATTWWVLFSVTWSSGGALSQRGVDVLVYRSCSTCHLLPRPLPLPLGSLARVSFRRNLISCLGFAFRFWLGTLLQFCGLRLPFLSVLVSLGLALLSPEGTVLSVLSFYLHDSSVG